MMANTEEERIVKGYVLEHPVSKIRVKATNEIFKKQWERRGFEVIHEGDIDISEWNLNN